LAYIKAGADVIFPERPLHIKDLKEDIRNINAPVLLNGLRLGLSVVDVAKMGFAIVIMSRATFAPAVRAAYDFLMKIKNTGKYPSVQGLPEDIAGQQLEGLSEVRAYEEKFLPTEDLLVRYGTEKVPREF
jgi:2-methylisocitrate lyase-like PEP mutase family enzyme